MRQLILLLLLMPLYAFAQSEEVAGQFVVAPISSKQCKASAITTPTFGLPADSELFAMLLSFISGDDDTTGIEYVKSEVHAEEEFEAVYDMSGRKLTTLQLGLNIVIDKEGNRKKIFVDK